MARRKEKRIGKTRILYSFHSSSYFLSFIRLLCSSSAFVHPVFFLLLVVSFALYLVELGHLVEAHLHRIGREHWHSFDVQIQRPEEVSTIEWIRHHYVIVTKHLGKTKGRLPLHLVQIRNALSR